MDTVFLIKGKITDGSYFTFGPYTDYDAAIEAVGILYIYLCTIFPETENSRYDACMSEYVLNVDELTHITNCVDISGVVGVK